MHFSRTAHKHLALILLMFSINCVCKAVRNQSMCGFVIMWGG